MAKGKLIVIEGVDGSGKATQAQLLYDRLIGEHFNVMKVEFPNYKSVSSSLVKMYLSGELGSHPSDVGPYAASIFFSVDRYISFKSEWEKFYNDGGIVIADRYTTSNFIHQAAEIDDSQQRAEYLKWLWDLEFVKLALPVPDLVLFLDVHPKYGAQLMQNRHNKATGEAAKDIHEVDYDYMIKSYQNSCQIADDFNWMKVECVHNGSMLSVDDIHSTVYGMVKNLL